MKKILLPEISEHMHYYRANLHCHSTISDGAKNPEELKEFYRDHGYSIIAYTDHNAFLTHNDLTDDTFLALNGYEIDIGEQKEDWRTARTAHICLIATKPEGINAVCYHREKYIWGNAAAFRKLIPVNEDCPDYERVYSAECACDIIKKGREGGFFVTYNHPTWSLESYPEYMSYFGMNAMEMVNFGCVVMGYDDDNGHCYEDMLRGGKKLYCIATDDNHNRHPDDGPYCDSFGGYVMIAAEKLEYCTVTKALEDGQFYSCSGTSAHNGAEIKSLVWEDNKVTIKTSPVREIAYHPCSRNCQIVHANHGETITEATFEVSEGEKWFRLIATDREGYKTYTNAYFPEDF